MAKAKAVATPKKKKQEEGKIEKQGAGDQEVTHEVHNELKLEISKE